MKKILFLFLFCISLYAKETSTKHTSIPPEVVKFNDSQKNILYEFAVLKKNGADANTFWLKNKNQFPVFSDNVRDKLANEIFANSRVIYTPAKNSSIQLWMQTQSLTTWMLYLAAFIAICAIIGLLRNYWSILIDVIIKKFVPIFRFLFSPVLLTYELLLIGILCIAGGCLVEDFFLRTVIIHIGIFLLWSQTTAIFTRKYVVQKYIFEIKNNFWENDKWEVIKTICLPGIIVTAALFYLLYKIPEDTFYNYEIVLSSLALIYALPFWRILEKYIYPILIPFRKGERVERSFYTLATCTVLALIADVAFIWQENPLFSYLITALTTLLIIAFNILSLKENYRNNYKNYYYLLFVTTVFFLFVLLYSFKVKSAELIWVSLIGVSVFIVIKYWEIPTFFISWKKRNLTWGFLGMALLLWLLAKGILYFSQGLYEI